jgi:hypothetical protein
VSAANHCLQCRSNTIQIRPHATDLFTVLEVVPRGEVKLMGLREQKGAKESQCYDNPPYGHGFPEWVRIINGIAAIAATVIRIRKAVLAIVRERLLTCLPMMFRSAPNRKSDNRSRA